MKNTATCEINASPERVFALINDSESLKQWVPNLVENEEITTTDEKVGSTFRQVYLENGRRMEMEGTVVAFEQDSFLACEIRGKLFDLYVDYTLVGQGSGTKLTQNSEVIFKSLPIKILTAIMKPFISKASQKQLDDQFAKLKELAETQ